MKRIQLIQILVAVAILVSCEEVPRKFETKYNRVNIAPYLYEHEEDYSSFIKVMEAGGLKDAMSCYNPSGDRYTLFLPDNDAFDRYVQESSEYSTFDELLGDTEFVEALARFHVVNTRIITNDFPLGALPDTTLNGYILTINYIQGEDSVYFKVNNSALVTREDMEMANGIIHVIDLPLEPVVYSGYDWIRLNPDYSLFKELLDITGLKDTLGVNLIGPGGVLKENPYTLLLEADSIFNKKGYFTIDDLIQKFSPDRTDYTAPENDLYQFVAYHIIDQAVFLGDLEGNRNYNTYAALPTAINAGADIRINVGVEKFDSIWNPGDSTYAYIDYINVKVNESNVQVRNGPIHFIDQIMELYRPGRSLQNFQFYEEPLINEIRYQNRRFIFEDVDDFTAIEWSGTEELIWERRSSSSENAWNRDFLEIDGDFSITYKLPKILPGQYGVQIRADHRSSQNATIQVFLDGKQIGDNLNLTTGGVNAANPYRLKNLTIVDLAAYETHTITIRSLIPGKFIWDVIRFQPDIEAYANNRQ